MIPEVSEMGRTCILVGVDSATKGDAAEDLLDAFSMPAFPGVFRVAPAAAEVAAAGAHEHALGARQTPFTLERAEDLDHFHHSTS
jgi:hypothetical protein